jgi:hypothetical protein
LPARINPLIFAIATGGKVAGTVTSSSGTAISGAAVTVTGGSIGTTVKTTTSSTGVYTSNGVPVGTYTVTVCATRHTPQNKTTTIYHREYNDVEFHVAVGALDWRLLVPRR